MNVGSPPIQGILDHRMNVLDDGGILFAYVLRPDSVSDLDFIFAHALEEIVHFALFGGPIGLVYGFEHRSPVGDLRVD